MNEPDILRDLLKAVAAIDSAPYVPEPYIGSAHAVAATNAVRETRTLADAAERLDAERREQERLMADRAGLGLTDQAREHALRARTFRRAAELIRELMA